MTIKELENKTFNCPNCGVASGIGVSELEAAYQLGATTVCAWEPIETAPKDGWFLGGVNHRTYGWLWDKAEWHNDKHHDGGGYFLCKNGCEPSHWLKLPPAPVRPTPPVKAEEK
jgi:hypothetical protein